MSDEKSDAGRQTKGLVEAIDAIVKQSQAAHVAEAARRASLSPAQRAAEDAAQLARITEERAAKFRKMGPGVLARESWTIADFAWLLTGRNPDEAAVGFFGRDDSQSEPTRYRNVLESCVGRRLHPLNPEAGTGDRRYAFEDLLATAASKNLGWHAALTSVIPESLKARTSPSAPTDAREHSAPLPAALPGSAVSVESTAEASVPTFARTGVDRAAARPSPELSPEPTAEPSLADCGESPQRTRKPTAWHAALEDLLRAVVSGAHLQGVELDRHKLPETAKQLFALLHDLYRSREGTPPDSLDALHKQLQRTGWRFGGAGHKKVSGVLRAYAVAGGLTELQREKPQRR